MVRVCPFRRKESKENITFGICAGNRRRQLKRIPGIFRTDTSVVRFKTPGYVRYWLGRTCSNAPTVYLLFEQTPDRSVFPSCTPTSFEACRQFCRRIRFGTAETRSLRVQVFAKRGACRTERKGETTSVTGDGCTTVEWLRVRASGIRERERRTIRHYDVVIRSQWGAQSVFGWYATEQYEITSRSPVGFTAIRSRRRPNAKRAAGTVESNLRHFCVPKRLVDYAKIIIGVADCVPGRRRRE